MTTQDQRIFDLLETIEHTPGISAGHLEKVYQQDV
jgi:hypothetical protein